MTTLLMLTGAHSLQNATAEGETRSLSLHHMHTGEDITITYKRDGRYDDTALQKLDWFLRDWRREEQTRMDPHLFDVIWEVEREVGAKDPVQVVCGYRSPKTNAMLRQRGHGVAQFSQHMLGRAMDFYIPGVPLEQIRFAGLRLQRGGVGFYPTSGSPFVHLDTGNVRHWPRMTHDQLVRVFPDGKTVHIPSDGHPLPRFAVALAEIQHRGASPSATTLAEARSAGAITDSDVGLADKPKRGFLAKLFGFGRQDEDADEDADTGNASVAAAPAPLTPAAAPARPTPAAAPQAKQLASVIPIPSISPAKPKTYAMASVQTTPADIVNARGTWGPATQPTSASADSSPAAPQSAAGAVGAINHRFVWLSGPPGQPRPAADPLRPRSVKGAEDPSPPRPPQAIEVADAEPDATATIGPWTVDRNDRVPTEFALAYAATPEQAPAVPRRAVPMGSVGVVTRAPSTQATPTTTNRAQARTGERIDNPWLRSVVLSPSVRHTMSVAMMGPTDYRSLATLMKKPHSAVAIGFSEDPLLGVEAETFSGAAVAFLPTVSFIPTHSARLE